MSNLLHQRKFLQQYNENNKRFKTQEEIDLVIALYRQGMSSIQIAKKFNCSKPTILKILKFEKKRKSTDYSHHYSKVQGFGENHHSWKGGFKSIYDRIRDLKSYWDWRKAVLDRDGNICKNCAVEENLEVHHIKTLKILVQEYSNVNDIPIKDFTEEHLKSTHFYDINNGITYCKDCHRSWHKNNGR